MSSKEISLTASGEDSTPKGGRVGWAKHPYRRWRATSPKTGEEKSPVPASATFLPPRLTNAGEEKMSSKPEVDTPCRIV